MVHRCKQWPWMTLKGEMTVSLRYFTEFNSFRELITSNSLKTDPCCLQRKCSQKNLVFGIVRLILILSEIVEKECINERHPALESKNSNCAALLGHLSNSRAFLLSYAPVFTDYRCCNQWQNTACLVVGGVSWELCEADEKNVRLIDYCYLTKT